MRDPFRIDSHKLHFHPGRVAAWLEAQDSWEKMQKIYPIYVEISPFGACNHKCTFCGVDYMLERPDKPKLEFELLCDVISNMAEHGVLSIMFAGAGEPLLYKRLADLILHADACGIDTSITTNGVFLNEAFCRKVFAAKRLRWIKVSINGGDAPTYERIHQAKPGDFETVMKNLAKAVEIRKELGQGPTLGGQLVALPEITRSDPKRPLIKQTIPSNLETAAPLAERLREAGVDYLVIKPYSQHIMSEKTRVYDHMRYAEAHTWAERAVAYTTETFAVTVRYQTMEHWDSHQRGYQSCHATPSFWGYLEADGNVWGCSAYLGRDEGGEHFGDDRFRYGNVHDASFSDIWEGERRRQNWEYIKTPTSEGGLNISNCRVNCRMDGPNRYLDGLIHPNPHHTFI